VFGEKTNAIIITVIVLLSILLNYIQSSQAYHAVEALRKQVATKANVTRDGHEFDIPVTDLVPGDIIHLAAGDLVPADARLLSVNDFTFVNLR
jgi:Mg2+-importing ATPase